jgi:hypothetical protein
MGAGATLTYVPPVAKPGKYQPPQPTTDRAQAYRLQAPPTAYQLPAAPASVAPASHVQVSEPRRAERAMYQAPTVEAAAGERAYFSRPQDHGTIPDARSIPALRGVAYEAPAPRSTTADLNPGLLLPEHAAYDGVDMMPGLFR